MAMNTLPRARRSLVWLGTRWRLATSGYQNGCTAATRARPVFEIGMYPHTLRFLRAVRTQLTTARYVL